MVDIEEIYNKETKYWSAVYNIFKDYFGEERVDLQGIVGLEKIKELCNDVVDTNIPALITGIMPSSASIIIHFPEVRVTNENDRYVDIQDLWAKVSINKQGALTRRFQLNRTTYPKSHLIADYQHSHTPGINRSHPESFREPCTGSGPINRTMASLMAQFDEDIWMLFCRELDLYTTVESLTGGPYRRLESIGKNNTRLFPEQCTPNIINDVYFSPGIEQIVKAFTEYLLKLKILKFSFTCGTYTLGTAFKDFRILISNTFIKWYNNSSFTTPLQDLIALDFIVPLVLKDGVFYTSTNASVSLNDFAGRPAFTFKGEQIYTKVLNDTNNEQQDNTIHLISVDDCCKILSLILYYLNYNFNNGNNNFKSSFLTGELPSTFEGRTIFL